MLYDFRLTHSSRSFSPSKPSQATRSTFVGVVYNSDDHFSNKG